MKNTATAPTKVQEIQAQIEALNAEIVTHQEEILKFEESIVMIQNFPGWEPRESAGIFQMLHDIIATEPEAEQRAKRLHQAKSALEESKKLLVQKKNTVSMLEELRSAEESEAEWQRKYAPFTLQYESGFASAPDPNALKISQIEKDLQNDRWELARAKTWLDADDSRKPRYNFSLRAASPQQDYDRLSERIAALEKTLESLRQQPPLQRDEAAFRAYIAARVEIEQPLQTLLEAQERYAQALSGFKTASAGREIALGFSAEELSEPVQVVVRNNQIILGNKNG